MNMDDLKSYATDRHCWPTPSLYSQKTVLFKDGIKALSISMMEGDGINIQRCESLEDEDWEPVKALKTFDEVLPYLRWFKPIFKLDKPVKQQAIKNLKALFSTLGKCILYDESDDIMRVYWTKREIHADIRIKMYGQLPEQWAVIEIKLQFVEAGNVQNKDLSSKDFSIHELLAMLWLLAAPLNVNTNHKIVVSLK